MTDQTKKKPGDERHIRPFSEWLLAQASGRTHSELSDGLNELVAAVRETGKGGTLTLTVKVKPATKHGSEMVVVTDDVKVKLPAGERVESLFFLDEHANLLRRDPRQPELPLREVPAAERTDTVKEVSQA